MKTRLRFSKERVSKAFTRGLYSKKIKPTVTPSHNKIVAMFAPDEEELLAGLAEADKDSLDDIVREMDAALGEILAKQKKKERDGEDCVKCGTFYPQAEPNQPNGTLICYSCRHFG